VEILSCAVFAARDYGDGSSRDGETAMEMFIRLHFREMRPLATYCEYLHCMSLIFHIDTI
jgi:hypothetical protein